MNITATAVCAECDEVIVLPDDGFDRWSHPETGSIYCHHTGDHHRPLKAADRFLGFRQSRSVPE